jgi:hypothetical protein
MNVKEDLTRVQRLNPENINDKTKMYIKLLKYLTVIVISLLNLSSEADGSYNYLYESIVIDLKPFLGKEAVRSLNWKIYNAAKENMITPYLSDSISGYYSNERFIKNCTKSNIFNSDSNQNVPFEKELRPEDIISNRIGFKLQFDEKNNFRLEFTGISLRIKKKYYQLYVGVEDLFYVSTTDMVKILGKDEAIHFFYQCFRAMLKTVHSDTLATPVNITTIDFYLKYIFTDSLRKEFNYKMIDCATSGTANLMKLLTVYTTENLNIKYTHSRIMEMINQQPEGSKNSYETHEQNIFCWRQKFYDCHVYSFAEQWRYDSVNMTATASLVAFGIHYGWFNYDSVKVYSGCLFWISWKDAGKIFSPPELTLLKYSFFLCFSDLDIYDIMGDPDRIRYKNTGYW